MRKLWSVGLMGIAFALAACGKTSGDAEPGANGSEGGADGTRSAGGDSSGSGAIAGGGADSGSELPRCTAPPCGPWVAMESADGHFCVLSRDGRVACMGHAPLWVDAWSDALAEEPGLNDVVELAEGRDVAFAVDSTGVVYRWGAGYSGGVDDPLDEQREDPAPAPTLADLHGIASASPYDLCALDTTGTLHCRFIGTCTPPTLMEPVATLHPLPLGDGFERVVAGESGFCAQRTEGVTCWGYLERGQATTDSGCQVSEPLLIDDTAGFVQLLAVRLEYCGLRPDGEVSCWGSPPHCVSSEPCPEATLTPREIPELRGATQLFAMRGNLCGALPGGLLRCGERSASTGTPSPTEWVDHNLPDEVIGVGMSDTSGAQWVVLTADGRLWQMGSSTPSPLDVPAGF